MPTDVHYPGSSGYVTGDLYPSTYGISWDPVTRQVRSNDPRVAGYDAYGRLKTMAFPSNAATAGGVNPYASLFGGYSQVAMPGVGGDKVAQLSSGTGYNPTAAPGAGYNPYFTVSNTKSPEFAALINKLLGQYTDVAALNPTKMITEASAAADPAYTRYLNEETGAIGNWYNGDIKGQLEGLRAERAKAYSTATDRGLDSLSRVLALNQMGQGGQGNIGSSSYIEKMALDTAANFAAQAGLDDATQGRTDLMTLLQGQQANLGARSGLQTQDINRKLLPSQVGASWFSQMVAPLMQLQQMQLGNTFYGLGGATQDQSMPAVGYNPGNMYSQTPAVRNSPTVMPFYPRAQLSGTSAASQSQLSPLDTIRQQILGGDYSGWQSLINNSRAVYPGEVADAQTSYF